MKDGDRKKKERKKDGDRRMKRQARDTEKTLANLIHEKEFVFRIYKELSKLNSKKAKGPVRTCAINMNRHFTKKDK